MAFEILFYFYPKREGGGYDTENSETFTQMVGRGAEEVSLDKVAGAVMVQRARRDILIFDVEVYETVRRKISFKETKGGVIIKNRKYSFDQGVSAVMDDDSLVREEEQEEVPAIRREYEEPPPPRLKQEFDEPMPQFREPSKPRPVDEDIARRPPLRWEVFTPDQSYLPILKQKNVPLTVNQKYPIMNEKVVEQNVGGNSPYGTQSLIYTVIADNGKPFTVHSCHFLPPTKGLYGIDYNAGDVMVEERGSSAGLLFMGGGGTPDMPVIRR